MSQNSFKISKSLVLAPSVTPSNPENGEIYLDIDTGKVMVYENGAWLTLVDTNILATESTLSALNEKIPLQGQSSMASSIPVVIASDQTALPISISSISLPTGAATESTLSALNTKAATESTLSALNTKVTAVNTGNVTISSSALPTGAATESTLSTLSGKIPSQGQASMASSIPVVIASNQSAVPISASSLPLPTGAATESTLSALNIKMPSQGQASMAASIPVVIASNQSALPVTDTGLSKANAPVYNNYSSTNVTTSSYTQLIASTTSAAKKISIFDSSGQAMILAIGAAGSEVIQVYVPPGGADFNLAIPANVRIAIKALTATASSGYILLNLLG